MTTTTRDVLIAARALIADERNWIKGANFRKVAGCDCFCADGAVEEVFRNRPWEPGVRPALRAASPNGMIVTYNDADETTHADVLAMFDRAIEACS